MSGHDGMVIMVGTLVVAALVVAVGYLFLHRSSADSAASGGGGTGSVGSGSSADPGKVVLGGLTGALTGVSGSLYGGT